MNPDNGYERYERKERQFEKSIKYAVWIVLAIGLLHFIFMLSACSVQAGAAHTPAQPYQPAMDTLWDCTTGEVIAIKPPKYD